MTKAELNRDVARLGRKAKIRKIRINAMDVIQAEDWKVINAEEEGIKAEIKRLFYADDTFEYLNRTSILTLLRLNLSFRAVPLHVFGLMIKD